MFGSVYLIIQRFGTTSLTCDSTMYVILPTFVLHTKCTVCVRMLNVLAV